MKHSLKNILAMAAAKAQKAKEEKEIARQLRYTEDLRPLLENLISCCRENHVEHLSIILDKYSQELVAEPIKILNAYLNYTTTGHDEVLIALNQFVKKHNLKIKDENFECVSYLLFNQKEKEFLKLFDAGLWELEELKTFLLNQNRATDPKTKTQFIQAILVELEKHMIKNHVPIIVNSTTKSSFKI